MNRKRLSWVHLTLFFLLFLQMGTGYWSMINGRLDRLWVVWSHGIGAYLLLLLLFWKGAVIWQIISRGRWTAERWGALAMGGLVLAVLFTGFAWTFNGPIYWGGFSLMTIHVFLAVLTTILLMWHSWRRRWIWRAPAARDRRAARQAATATLVGAAVWWLIDRGKAWWAVPGTDRRFTGSYERGSWSNRFPAVSWIADRPQPIELETWRLTIDGAVDTGFVFTYDELRAQPPQEIIAILDCTGGFYTEQLWRGVSLGHLLAKAGLQEDAQSVTIRAVSGYQRRLSIAEAKRALLAMEVADEPLRHGHGFPLRLVAPEQRGVNWVKWIVAIEVNTTRKVWQLPLPIQ